VRRASARYPCAQKRTHRDDHGRLDSWGLTRVVEQRKCRGTDALLAAALLLLVPGLQRAGQRCKGSHCGAGGRKHGNRGPGQFAPLRAPSTTRARSTVIQLERITLMFQPTAAQQADLDGLLAAQQNPTSSTFHQWLTPEQYADRFGIAQTDLNKVTAWLQSQGFDIVEIPRSRNWIVF